MSQPSITRYAWTLHTWDLWQPKDDEVARDVLFGPLCAILKAHGWKVGNDPWLDNFPTTHSKCRLGRFKDCYVKFEILGRTLGVRTWFDGNRHKVRGEVDGATYLDRLRLTRVLDLIQRTIEIAYDVTVKRDPWPNGTAAEILAKNQERSFHKPMRTNAEVRSMPKYNRTCPDGPRLLSSSSPLAHGNHDAQHQQHVVGRVGRVRPDQRRVP